RDVDEAKRTIADCLHHRRDKEVLELVRTKPCVATLTWLAAQAAMQGEYEDQRMHQRTLRVSFTRTALPSFIRHLAPRKVWFGRHGSSRGRLPAPQRHPCQGDTARRSAWRETTRRSPRRRRQSPRARRRPTPSSPPCPGAPPEYRGRQPETA